MAEMMKRYEMTQDERNAMRRIAGDQSWGFTYDEVLAMSKVAQMCDIGSFTMFDMKKYLPKTWDIPASIDKPNKLKVFISDLLEDCNFHGESCLIDGCCYRLLDEHYNMLKAHEEE